MFSQANERGPDILAATPAEDGLPAGSPVDYQQRVPAVERTVLVLQTIVRAEHGRTLAELSRATRITPSSLLAILNTLRRHALVRRTEPDGLYVAGPGLVALGEAAARRLSAANGFSLVAEGLVGRTGETALLWLQVEGSRYVLAAAYESTQPLRYAPVPGARFETTALQADAGGFFDLSLAGNAWQVAVPLSFGGETAGRAPALLAIAGPADRVRGNPTVRAALRGAVDLLRGEFPGSTASQAAGPISRPDLDTFLGQGHVANLSYLSADGYPATVPLWYHWDGTSFWFLPRPGAEWPSHVERQPRVSLAISESEAPLRRVIARGFAEVVEDADGRFRAEMGERMAERYAAFDVDHYLDRQVREKGALLRLTPERLLTWRGLLHHPRLGHSGTGARQAPARRRHRKDTA